MKFPVTNGDLRGMAKAGADIVRDCYGRSSTSFLLRPAGLQLGPSLQTLALAGAVSFRPGVSGLTESMRHFLASRIAGPPNHAEPF
jgi:hypothetical protein